MKIISTLSFKNLSIALICCNLILLAGSCSKNDEPEMDYNSDSNSKMPTIKRLNIKNFNGYYLTKIHKKTSTFSEGSAPTTSGEDYTLVKYNVYDDKYKKTFDLNFGSQFSSMQSFFSYPDKASFGQTYARISSEAANFSPQGLLLQVSYNDYYAYVGNVHTSAVNKDITYIFTYNKAGYLLESRTEIKSDEVSSDDKKSENIKATTTAITSYEWEEGNLKTVTYDYQTTDPRKSSYTKIYELTYSDVENGFRQYPYSLSQFFSEDVYLTPCFTVGLMGRGPAKTLQKITVIDKDGKKTTYDINITYKYLNGLKVMDKEKVESDTNTTSNKKEYSEYTFTYQPINSIGKSK